MIILLFFCSTVSYSFLSPQIPVRNRRLDTKLLESNSVLSWLDDKGVLNNDRIIEFLIDKSGVIRSKATRTIKKGEVIFSIPFSESIGPSNTKLLVDTSNLRSKDFGALSLLLLQEKSLSTRSKYNEYIQSLPSSPPGILSWNEDEIRELSTSTTRRVTSQFDAIFSDYKYLTSVEGSSLLPSTLKSILSPETFTWAVGIVKSRSIFINNTPLLIPGMDFIENDPLSTAEPYLTGGNFLSGKVIKVVAERNYDIGESVVISFGLKSSAECLEDYGVVPDISYEDGSCEFTVSIDEEQDKYPDDKIDVLERYGVTSRQVFDLDSAEGDVGLDPELLRFLRLKLIQGPDSFILEACLRDSVWSALALPFSKSNEIRVFEYIVDTCRGLLESIGGGRDEEDATCDVIDSALVLVPEDASQETKRSMMARLRLQERAALRGTIRAAKAELATLTQGSDYREYYQERRLMELNLLRPLDPSEIIPAEDRRPAPFDDGL